MNGTNVLVLADTGGGVFVAVGSQRRATFTETNAAIDASSKEARERKVDAGRYEATVSFDALYVPSNAAYAALKAALRNGTKIKLRESENGVAIEEVNAIITSLTREFPDQDEATITMECAIDGAITVL